ncbi:MAG: AAA family ATPase [Clostridia bacterium]|nr:AAA family ATPase [Clostridia bacterium]
MLLNFSFKNFRSFRDLSSLDMTPANIRDIPYSVLKTKIKKEYKALSSSIIYGANASGKSNVILALAFMRELVISGNLKNQRCIPVELIPCFCDSKSKTIDLAIEFIHNNYVFNYKIQIGNVKFLSDESNPIIERESLIVNEQTVFERKNKEVSFLAFSKDEDFEALNVIKEKATSSLLNDELFLTNGYKTLIDTTIYSTILNWFKEKLIIVKNIDFISSAPRFDYEQIGDATEDKFKLSDGIINKIAKEAGVNSTEIHFLKSDKDKKPQAFSVINGKGVVARFIESAGTMKMINFLPLAISVMVKGATLVIDELDSSLHPSAVFSIINAFHNDELNVNKAQLIFTSHNPIYQKAKIFRRDEIKFIERNKETSKIYNLSDFGTSGEGQVKNSTDIMKNYLTGKYGAINYIDFSEVIADALKLNGCKGNCE